MKKILIILGIVVVVIAGGVAIIVANLGKVVNSKKDYILERAETALGREVKIDDIGVTLSRGIGVKLTGVAIADDPSFSQERFVTAGDLTVRVKFWPLIKKKVEVKRLVLNEPVVNVIRDEEGVFNFASIVTSNASAADTPADAPDAAESAAAASVVLAFADVQNGTVRFRDRRGNLDLEITRVDFTAENAGLGQVASIDFAAAVGAKEQNIKLRGTVGPVERVQAPEDLKPTPLDLEAHLGPVTLDQIKRFLPDDIKPYRLGYLELGEMRASARVTGTLGALELSESEFTAELLGAPEPNLSVRAQAGPVDVVTPAREKPPAVPFAADMSLGPLQLDKVREKAVSAGVGPPELAMEGVATATVRLGGSTDRISVNARVDLTNGSISLGDKFNKPAGVPLTAVSELSVDTTAAAIEKCTITLAQLVVDVAGAVGLAGGTPSLDVSVRSNETEVAGFAELLPMLKTFAVGGTVQMLARASGPASQGTLPRIDGSVEVKNGSARLQQLPQPVSDANAIIAFTDKSARIESASFKVGRSTVRVDGKAGPLQPLQADYKITSREAFRTDFQTPPKPSPRPEVLRDVKIEGKIWQEGETIRHRGAVASTSGSLANVDYRDLNATIESTENRIDIPKFSAAAMGGTITGHGTFHPTEVPPRFEITTSVRKVNLAEYFTYKVESLPKFVEGTIDLDLDLAGSGKEWTEIQSTLTGKGGAVVIEGSLLNINVANELLTGLELLVPLIDRNALAQVRDRNPKLFSGNNTAFRDFKANVQIDGGRIHSKGMVLRTNDFSILGDGWVSFDQQLGITSSIVFSAAATKNIVRELDIFKYLADDKGQLVIPVTLGGTLTRLSVVPDVNALSKKLQNSAIDAGVDQLKGQVEGQVKDFLKGFGKKKSSAKKDSTQTP